LLLLLRVTAWFYRTWEEDKSACGLIDFFFFVVFSLIRYFAPARGLIDFFPSSLCIISYSLLLLQLED
jgi:hypothetical protein